MKTFKFLLGTALAFALTSNAFAQTTPTTTPPANGSTGSNGGTLGTVPGSRDTNGNQVGTMNDGANIGNNRDRLSTGAGTAPVMVDKSATRTKEMKRNRKMKAK